MPYFGAEKVQILCVAINKRFYDYILQPGKFTPGFDTSKDTDFNCKILTSMPNNNPIYSRTKWYKIAGIEIF